MSDFDSPQAYSDEIPQSIKTSKVIMQIYGWFLVVVGSILALIFIGMGIIAFSQGTSDSVAAGFFTFFMGIISGGIIIVLGIITLKAAKAVEARKNWGKIFGIIISILSLLNFPIGTLMAIFILIGLLGKDSEGWFIN